MKNRAAFLAGLSLFLCFCLLVAGGNVGTWASKGLIAWGILLAEVAAFLVPTVLLILPLRKGERLQIPVSTKRLNVRTVRLSIRLGIAVSLISFLLNLVCLHLFGQDVSSIHPASFHASDIGGNFLLYLFAIVIIPAIVEEIYVRGAIFRIFNRYAGTGLSIVLSALVFAMLHGSFYNFLGPFVAGIVFGWLTFVYDSIWPSAIAHLVNNLFYLIILWCTDVYSVFGIWNYFPAICLILVLFFIYLSLGSVERLLLAGRVPHFAQGQHTLVAIRTLIGNPASIAFILAFLAKTVFGVI